MMLEAALTALIRVITIGAALYAIACVTNYISVVFWDAAAAYQKRKRLAAEKKCVELSAELKKLKEEKTK